MENNHEVKILKNECSVISSLDQFLDELFSPNKISPKQEFPPEQYYGNIEYKELLCNYSEKDQRFQGLVTQMNFRLNEGAGNAEYFIGLKDDGHANGLDKASLRDSVLTLLRMASALKVDIMIVNHYEGEKGKILKFKIDRGDYPNIFVDIRVIMLGDWGAGKSTLLGVLIKGEKDNGYGKARMEICKNLNEVTQEMTNKITVHSIGFNVKGKITQSMLNNKSLQSNLIESNPKIVSMIDLGGHFKYTQSLISALLDYHPDYAILVIDINTNILSQTTKDQYKLALATKKPFILLLNKIDLLKDIVEFSEKFNSILSQLKLNQTQVMLINTWEDAMQSIEQIDKIVSVLPISCVTGQNLKIFENFLNCLPVKSTISIGSSQNFEFYVQSQSLKEKNLPASKNSIKIKGTVKKGGIEKLMTCYIGPCDKGNFYKTKIINIKCHQISIKNGKEGQYLTLEIELEHKILIRRGMVLLDENSNHRAAWEFVARIWPYGDGVFKILNENYEFTLSTQTASQKCLIVQTNDLSQEEVNLSDYWENTNIVNCTSELKEITVVKTISDLQEDENLIHPQLKKTASEIAQLDVKNFDKNNNQKYYLIKPKRINELRLKFKEHPEYINKDETFLIHDESIKAIGYITQIFYLN